MLNLIHTFLWRYMLRMGLVLRCSDAPDMTSVNTAAAASAELGRESLKWYQQQYADSAPDRAAANKVAMEVADAQLASSKQQTALAADYDQYNKSTFRPLEQGIVADASAYDTPEKRQAAADAALADTDMAFGRTNAATARQLAASGVDPGSTRAMSVMQGQGVDQATSGAAAAYKARQGVETVGRAMKMDAASLGRGLASNQATSAGLALNAGNAATANAVVPLQTAQSGANQMGAGFNSAMQGHNQAGNLYGQAARAGQQDTGIWGALGQLGGAAISTWSSKDLKTDIEPVDPDAALAEVTATPVSNWKYSPTKMAAKGIAMEPGMEGEQTGPMAQHVEKTMGGEVAPGGKKINLVSMNGKLMAATQALNTKVDRLAKMIGAGQLTAGEA